MFVYSACSLNAETFDVLRAHSFVVCVSHFTSFHFVVKRVCLYESATIIFYVHKKRRARYHLEWWEMRMREIIKKNTHTIKKKKIPLMFDFSSLHFIVTAFIPQNKHPKLLHIHAHCLRLFIYSLRFYPMLLSLFICNFPCRKVYLTTFYLDCKTSHRIRLRPDTSSEIKTFLNEVFGFVVPLWVAPITVMPTTVPV